MSNDDFGTIPMEIVDYRLYEGEHGSTTAMSRVPRLVAGASAAPSRWWRRRVIGERLVPDKDSVREAIGSTSEALVNEAKRRLRERNYEFDGRYSLA